MKHNRIGLLTVIVFFSLLLPVWCSGAEGDGNSLLSECGAAVDYLDAKPVDNRQLASGSFCLGLMQGILHMDQIYSFENGSGLICEPDGFNTAQAARIVVKYLREHPEELHQSSSILAFVALRAAFPCKQ